MKRLIQYRLNKRQVYALMKNHVKDMELPAMKECSFSYFPACGCNVLSFYGKELTYYEQPLKICYSPKGHLPFQDDLGRVTLLVSVRYLMEHKMAYIWDDETNMECCDLSDSEMESVGRF